MVLYYFNDTATTEIYTLSLRDALPISASPRCSHRTSTSAGAASGCSSSGPATSSSATPVVAGAAAPRMRLIAGSRSEEHTSELQSRQYLVCRLLLEKKNKQWLLETNNT